MVKPSIDEIDSWLPQTQCTQCGYPRCRAYAWAIAEDRADINQCPPGGEQTIQGLARLLGGIGKPLNPEFGTHQPKVLVRIDEDTCIGCTLCIQACPVDAIIGAAKLMHSVITDQCTGCELCIPPCPVDCIETVLAPAQRPEPHWRWPEYSPQQADIARTRTGARVRRLRKQDREKALKKKHLEMRRGRSPALIRGDIEASVARVRARRGQHHDS